MGDPQLAFDPFLGRRGLGQLLDVLLQGTSHGLKRGGQFPHFVAGPDLAALARTLGVSGLAADAYELQADAGFEPGLVRIQALSLASGGDRLSVTGLLGTGAALAGSDLEFTLALRQAAQLAAVLGKQLEAPEALALEGRVRTDAEGHASLRARAQYVDSVLVVDGALGALSGPFQPDLSFDFRSADPRPLARLLGDLPLPGVPLAARGRVSLPGAQLELDHVELELGDHRARLDGHLGPQLRLAGSEFEVRLDTPDVADLARLFDRVGEFNEAMVRNQDYEMNYRIRRAGGRILDVLLGYLDRPGLPGVRAVGIGREFHLCADREALKRAGGIRTAARRLRKPRSGLHVHVLSWNGPQEEQRPMNDRDPIRPENGPDADRASAVPPAVRKVFSL